VNQLDYILIFIILLGIGTGLRRGFVRVLVSIVGIYFTVIVAGYAYKPIGDIVTNALGEIGFRISAVAAHNFVYIVVVIAMTVAEELISRMTFEETRIESLRGFDNLLGGLVGVFYGVLWASLFLVPSQYGVSRGGLAWRAAILQSTLAPQLNQLFQSAVLDIVSILFIKGTPELFLNSISQRVSILLPYWISLGRFWI
jgi:uncharacterized membrane protein required for colicin V production